MLIHTPGCRKAALPPRPGGRGRDGADHRPCGRWPGMTNEVAKSLRGLGLRDRVPQHAAVPDLPPELARAVAMTDGEASDRHLPRPGHVAIEQAIAAIPAYAAVDEPTSREVVEGWLDRVMLAVVNPPDPDERKARLAAIIALADD